MIIGEKDTQKINTSVIFTCPECKENFEFDFVDEYQYVHCPICGIELMTIRKNQILLLEPFEFDQRTQIAKMKLSVHVELR